MGPSVAVLVLPYDISPICFIHLHCTHRTPNNTQYLTTKPHCLHLKFNTCIASWLHRETKRPRKKRRTAKHLHQDLEQVLGYNWMQSNRNPHKHLFIADMGFPERLKDANEIQLITELVPWYKWKALIEDGDPLIEGSGWGTVRDFRPVQT
jgi:hypothetical protein